MASPDSFNEANFKKQTSELVEPNIGIRPPSQYLADRLLVFAQAFP